jgi:hypothetical protein
MKKPVAQHGGKVKKIRMVWLPVDLGAKTLSV